MTVTPGAALEGTVLLTGASGFVGRRTHAALERAGVDVLTLRRPASPTPKTGRSVVADYEDIEALTALFASERPRYVVHLAGVTKGVSYEDFARGNVLPTAHLLTAIERARAPVERFVHVSSLAAFGPSTKDRPHDESSTPNPVEHYGKSKLEAERAVEQSTVPFTILRPGGVYGPGDVDYFELFRQCARGWNVFFGNRARVTSVVHVDDLVDATLGALRSPAGAGRGYFVCDGEPVTWEQLQREVARAAGRAVRELDLPEGLVDVAALGGELLSALDRKPRLFNRQKAIMGRQTAWTCTHAAARRDLGYVPQVALARGVEQTFEWYRNEGWL
jgi:nucleoside-diphosphate-sugar epimerase